MSRAYALGSWVSILLLVLVVNLPAVYGSIQDQRLAGSGVDTVATVLGVEHSRGNYWVAFRLPTSLDPRQQRWPAAVDRATYDRAVSQHTVQVRVLKGDPKINKVVGEKSSHAALWLAIVCDLVIVFLVLGLRRRARNRQLLDEYVAVSDVTRGVGAPALEPLEDGTVVVAGDVEAIEHDAITVQTPSRLVRVVLAGHDNPVGHQQAARVLARPVRRDAP